MPKSQYLDAFVTGALLDAPEGTGLPGADRQILCDLVALARAFVRLDADERAAVIADVHGRAVDLLPAESHPFFVDDSAPTRTTTSNLGAAVAIGHLVESGTKIVADNARGAFVDAASHRLGDPADGLQTGRAVGDENVDFSVD
ncbi:hypothetical protein [Salinarimonas sp.]|uniref:hypothetical protein n=1 Tax=Salinarimonas sp. TaxID=2766526 RepID=UPI003918EA0D